MIQAQFLRFELRVFSFSLTGCQTKAKEPSLLYYLLIAEEGTEVKRK